VRNPEVDWAASPPLASDAVWSTLASVKPADAPLVTESTSTMAQQLRWLPTTRPASFFATAGGGIGWGVPAAVGLALGDRARGVKRTVVATIGDGSFQYSVQAIWTAAQHRLPVVFVVMRNEEYSILKSFAELEQTPGACLGWICLGWISPPSPQVSGAGRSTLTAPKNSPTSSPLR
jgi:benzoylformate decarboxylase